MLPDRIKTLIEMLGLTNAEFANEINVQASSISHLISGRNKPSVEFIEKLHHRFPDVQINWLLFGEGHPFIVVKEKGTLLSQGNNENETKDKPKDLFNIEESLKKSSAVSSLHTEPKSDFSKIDDSQLLGKKLKKVILFYSDGSLEEFNS